MQVRRLDRHLATCAECATFALDIAAVSLELGSADLEVCRIPTPRRAQGKGRSLQRLLVVAAAVAVAAPVLGVVFTVSRSDELRNGPATSIDDPMPVAPSTATRGVPIIVRQVLPLGQLKAVDDF